MYIANSYLSSSSLYNLHAGGRLLASGSDPTCHVSLHTIEAKCSLMRCQACSQYTYIHANHTGFPVYYWKTVRPIYIPAYRNF